MAQQASSTPRPSAPNAQARIDWGAGRVVGYCVAGDDGQAFDVVQLVLGGHDLLATVANRSAFNLGLEKVGLNLPLREYSAFEFRIPHASLLPGQLNEPQIRLELRATQSKQVFFRHELQGAKELLALVDGAPDDLLFDVRFTAFRDGAVYGVLHDRFGVGRKPELFVRVNQHAPRPLSIFSTSPDGRTHQFSAPVAAEQLTDGLNQVMLQSDRQQPLAAFPIQIGPSMPGASDRRLMALEAEVKFLRDVVFSRFQDPLPAKLNLLKSEVINICSDMLTLQRTNLERELFGQKTMNERKAAPTSTPTAAPAKAAEPTLADTGAGAGAKGRSKPAAPAR